MEILGAYSEMLEAAVEGRIPLMTFCVSFMAKFKDEKAPLPESLFEVLNEVFLDSDEFESDPEILAEMKMKNPDYGIDAVEYAKRLAVSLNKLKVGSANALF